MPSYRSRSLPVATLLAVTLLAGCGSDSSEGGNATDDTGDAAQVSLEQLDAERFAASSADAVEGHALVDGTTITVSFDGRTINAHAGCNHLFGDATIADGVLSVKGLGGTEMGCPEDLMAQDDWLVELLASDPSVALDGGTLTISSGDSMLRMNAVEGADEPPADDPDEPTSDGG